MPIANHLQEQILHNTSQNKFWWQYPLNIVPRHLPDETPTATLPLLFPHPGWVLHDEVYYKLYGQCILLGELNLYHVHVVELDMSSNCYYGFNNLLSHANDKLPHRSRFYWKNNLAQVGSINFSTCQGFLLIFNVGMYRSLKFPPVKG